jgi:beta-mannosidase
MKRRALEGPWRLSYRCGEDVQRELPGEATVPGNVELDLSGAGLLPADLFFGENILAVRAFEDAEWWYSCGFDLDAGELASAPELVFHGVDGDAEYLLNGEALGTSTNSLIEHRFAIGRAGQEGRNELVVHLRPLRPPAAADEMVPLWSMSDPLRRDSTWVRKAPHVFGWDIMPRALSAGLWRGVDLVVHDEVEIARLYPATIAASEDEATLRVYYELRGALPAGCTCRLVAEGRCGSSTFRLEGAVSGRSGVLVGPVHSPRLWWPRGYGEPNCYELTTELRHDGEHRDGEHRDGEVLATRTDRIGLRTVELVRRPSTNERRGDFRFVVNGVPVYCRGTNWVPLDTFHSRDRELLASRLELLWRTNSNMVRCWGGNVYENDAFFDWCDERGVMVWQDFALACAVYPQTEELSGMLRHEVRAVLRRLRHHPSIVLWCGDNEVDQTAVRDGIAPESNLLTRRVIPEVVHAEDPHRPYLPSSPFVDGESEEVLRSRDLRGLPEAHLWGPRDYYKSEFYRDASAAFVSEIGFMGLPGVASMRKFLDEQHLWPHENRQWLVHGTDPTVDFSSRYWWRTAMTLECVRIFFGALPAELADAVVASQLVQAEGFKYAIESGRQAKWRRSGVLWWNLVDGWPQISDAVVDYYLGEKLAFDVIARVQQPLLLLAGEPSGAGCPLLACNDTRRDVTGSYVARVLGEKECLAAGRYESPANATVRIGALQVPARQSMIVIEWSDDDGQGRNHHLAGEPPFALEQLREWYEVVLGRPL